MWGRRRRGVKKQHTKHHAVLSGQHGLETPSVTQKNASLSHLPQAVLSHSSAHKEPARLRGRDVTVVGGGASAVDLAVLLQEAGAPVTLVARRDSLVFVDPPPTSPVP